MGEPFDAGLFPPCHRCGAALVPLSDYHESTSIHYKAWVCTDPDCGFNLKIRRGEIVLDEPVRTLRPEA